MKYFEEHRKTPVQKECHLLIVGAGIAGVAAAISARRCGIQDILIVDKSFITGGLATSGLISLFEPLCDGRGNRIMYGLAEELFKLSITYGYDNLPHEWQGFPDKAPTSKRCRSFFSPAIFTMGIEHLLENLDIPVMFDVRYCGAIMKDELIKGIVAEGYEGRFAVEAKVVIDATGDALVFRDAHIPCVQGDNYLCFIGYRSDLTMARKAVQSKNIKNILRWENLGADLWGKGHPNGIPALQSTDSQTISNFVLKGRKMLFDKIKNEDRYTRDIIAIPSMPQYRKTRRIIGNETLTEADMGKHFSSSIAACSDFSQSGQVYEIPFGTLWNKKVPNLITAGRSISSGGWAWDVTRVIPVAALTGQAAGTASALCILKECTLHDLNIEELQTSLKEQNMRLHFPDGIQ